MFGDRLKEARKNAQMTLEDVANKYNKAYDGRLSKGTLSNYENGKQQPLSSVIPKLAAVLNVSVDFLLGLEGINEEYLTPEYQQNRADEVKALEEKSLKECKDTLKGLLGKDVVTLIDLFLQLNEQGKSKALDALEDLSAIDKYIK